MIKARPKCSKCDKNQYSKTPALCFKHFQEYAKTAYSNEGLCARLENYAAIARYSGQNRKANDLTAAADLLRGTHTVQRTDDHLSSGDDGKESELESSHE